MKKARKSIRMIITAILAFSLGGCASRVMLHPELARRLETRDASPLISSHEPAEKVTVTNAFGHRLHGFLFASPGDKGTVLVSGGNAMSARHTLAYFSFLLDHGFRVLVFSFQGYDDNEGPADLNSLVDDAEAFFQRMATRYPEEKIAYAASSISSVAALCLPIRAPSLSAIVAEGVFNPKTIAFSRLKRRWYLFPFYPLLIPVAGVVSGTTPSALNVRHCIESYRDIPALFVHHPKDTVTPFAAAFDFYSAYRGEKRFLIPSHSTPPQYHNSLGQDLHARRQIIHFLKSRLSTQP